MQNSCCNMAVFSVHSSPLGNLGEKDTGGMSVYLRELSLELGKMGFGVDLYTRSTSADENGKIVRLGPGVRLIHLQAGPLQKLDKEKLPSYLPEFARKLEGFRKTQELSYDMIFSHYWISGLLGEALKKSWRVPHMTFFHTLGAAKNAAGIGQAESRFRLETEQQLAQSCSRIVVPTEREKKALIFHCKAPPAKLRVIPCGVNLELFRPMNKESARKKIGYSGEERLILFVGRPDPIKGLDQLIKGLSGLTTGVPFRLLVVGGGEKEKSRVEEFCRELQVRFPLHFLGRVAHSSLPYYYNAADLFVLPSYYESFGMAALESMACGTPVVASDVGDLKKIVRQGQTGCTLPSNDPRALAAGVETFLLRSKSVDRDRIRHGVASYGWPGVARQVAKACLEMLRAYSLRASC